MIRLLLPVFLLLLSLGCSPAPTGKGGPAETGDSLSPIATVTAQTTVTPLPTRIPTVPSSTHAPWLVIITPASLWTIRADGTGLAKVFDGHVLAPQDASVMPAPLGGFAAFITGDSRLRGLTLNILTLPRGLTLTIPLATPAYEPQDGSSPGDPELEAARALVELTSFAWSPDGRQLAFMGMREGPTADVYSFSMNQLGAGSPEQVAQGITRWTDEPSQGISPSWSPDGRYILHAGVNSLGTGAGYDMAGVWAVDTSTGEVLEVYTPEDGVETFVGWVDDDTFLVHSWTPACGNERLRAVDIPGGATRMIWEGAFNGIALSPETRNRGLLISVDVYAGGCKGGAGPGLFLLFPPEYFGVFTLVSEEAFLPVWALEGGMFFARTAQHLYGIRQQSDVIEVIEVDAPAPVLPVVSRWAERLVWALPSGVWVGALDAPPVQVFSSPASLPVVSPDGQTVFFMAEAGLYVAHAPDFIPHLVGEGLLGTGAFWVNP